jgi:hypothetical protein
MEYYLVCEFDTVKLSHIIHIIDIISSYIFL